MTKYLDPFKIIPLKKHNVYPAVHRLEDMSNPNQVTSPGDVAHRALVVQLIKSHPYWQNIWDSGKLSDWIDGTIESYELNVLYNLYFSGHITEVWNWIWSESGMNSQNPTWTQWGDTT